MKYNILKLQMINYSYFINSYNNLNWSINFFFIDNLIVRFFKNFRLYICVKIYEGKK